MVQVFELGDVCISIIQLMRLLKCRLEVLVAAVVYWYCCGLQGESSGVQNCKNTAGIRQEGHPEFKVLRCSSTKCGSKLASVKW